MCTSLDRAAGWENSTIESMEPLTLALSIQRYGKSHGVDSPTFNTLRPTPAQVVEMRQLVIQIRDRARAF